VLQGGETLGETRQLSSQKGNEIGRTDLGAGPPAEQLLCQSQRGKVLRQETRSKDMTKVFLFFSFVFLFFALSVTRSKFGPL
jgi:hypothetical protein